MKHWSKALLDRIGIVRIEFRKDLLFFFLPFFGLFVVELSLCESHGKGFTGLWGNLWEWMRNPASISAFPWHRIAGAALFLAGLTLMIVSQATLWKNYSGFVVIKRDHKLVTHGVYRLTRNPIYLGALIVLTGLPIYASSPLALLTVPLQVPILLNRIRMEEKFLSEEFRDDFRIYKERTKKLIPFVY